MPALKTFLLYFRSGLFFVSVPIFTILYTLFSITFVRFLPFRLRFRYLTLWSRTVIFLAKTICGINYRVTGLNNIPQDDSFVILAKHQSEWETFFLLNLFQPVTLVCKKELLKLPLGVGFGIKMLEPIAINRKKPKESLRQLLSEGGKSLQSKKMPVMIFPEGTRARAGKKNKYARSGAQLAIKTQKNVIFVTHNAGTYWPDKGFLKYPGTIDVIISEVCVTTKNITPQSLTDEAEQWIESHLPT